MAKRRDNETPAKWRWCKRAGWFCLAAVLATMVLLAFPDLFLAVRDDPTSCDAIVLLGGATGERDPVAAKLFRNGFVKHIVITGQGDCMANVRALEKLGVPTNAMLVECESRSTQQNAEFTVRILRKNGFANVILVTSWYHSRRALSCFQHYAPEIRFLSVPDERRPKTQNSFRFIADEYAKILAYALRWQIFPWNT
jgi:uncharacterized SAM-binding protein YcdF (DUF218 family)